MTSGATGAPIRVLLATGDRDLERRLLRALPEQGLVVSARCLDATTLVERSRDPDIDVVLVSADLHRLHPETLSALRERRRPVVLLTAGADDQERYAGLAHALPVSSSAITIAAALIDAEARGPVLPSSGAASVAAAVVDTSFDSTSCNGDAPAPETSRGRVIAVASGKGGPGKTTVAIALASGLGALGESVVLVDADRRGGNVAPALDLDPRRGLVGLAASTGLLTERLTSELQEGPHCAVLAGVERPELAGALRDETVSSAVAALRHRATWVVVDLGDIDTPADRAVLGGADEAIFVTGADLIAVWNARLVLPSLRAAAGGALISAVVNRREGREHYDRDEIERVLGVPVLGVVREDRPAARRAIAEQKPLTEAGGRAARDLQSVVAAIADGRARTSADPAAAIVGELAMER